MRSTAPGVAVGGRLLCTSAPTPPPCPPLTLTLAAATDIMRRMESLTPLAPEIWVATRPLKIVVGDIGTRMTVVRLRDGGLFVHSPVHLDAATKDALDAIGTVRCVVAPTAVHHFYVGDYLAAYPAARAFGAPGVAAKRPDLRFDAELSDQAPPEWSGVLEQHFFRGAPLMNEVVFFHPASRTLILTDLAFNMRRYPAGRARIFCWLVGAVGRFGPHLVIRLGIRDRRAAAESIRRILDWDFDRVTVTHGEVLESGGKALFAAAFAYLGAA